MKSRLAMAAPLIECLMLMACAGALCLLAACGKSAPVTTKLDGDDRVSVTVAKAAQAPFDRTLEVGGTFWPVEEAVISAAVEGRVERLTPDLGDAVSAGKVLAEIETKTYEAQAELAAANLAKAEANATNANQNLKQMQELHRDGINSDSDLGLALGEAGAANADVKAAAAELKLANLDVQRSRATAPFDAVVADRFRNRGDFVRVGAPLLRLISDAELKLILEVPENDAGQVRSGQLVSFWVPTFSEQTFEGKVERISPSIDATNHSFAVTLRVPNSNRKFRPGMNAVGALTLRPNARTVVVPVTAVQNVAGATRVFVVTDGVAAARCVRLGQTFKTGQEILSGLKAGETVVTSGQARLGDGAKVRLREGSAEK